MSSLRSDKTPHSPTQSQRMEQRSNMQRQNQLHHNWTKRENGSFNKCVENFYFMDDSYRFIVRYLLRSTSRGALILRACSRMGLALPRSSHPRESPRWFVLLHFPKLLVACNTPRLPWASSILFLHSCDALPNDALSSSLHN